MADNTKIEWTEATWNPVTGCTVTSPGCTNCYAMKLAGTRLQHHWSRKGLTTDTKAGPVWTGEVRFNEEWLTQPLKWKRPRMIFVCAHGDLFHESVPDEWIDRVFAVMALAPQHTFQVLTKRSARMRDYLNREESPFLRIHYAASNDAAGAQWGWIADRAPKGSAITQYNLNWEVRLPLPNVWLGVSVEDQTRADERIPDLLATPAAVRWLSCEPLLGPVDLGRILPTRDPECEDVEHATDALTGKFYARLDFERTVIEVARPLRGLDWVVAGGESGANARPMYPDWARSLRDQCAAAGVPFFFKQWGLRFPVGQTRADGTLQEETVQGGFANLHKSFAGRLLDGIEHNAFPST